VKHHSPGFLKLVAEAKQHVRECTVAEVRERLARGESFHFVDVREDHEWAASHAVGARHIGRGILERDVEHLIPDMDADIVLYCGGGYRSALAADSLQRIGYRRVLSMAGGMRAWCEAGYATQTGGDENK
jgi:rhodanese-related sulfurtransferase